MTRASSRGTCLSNDSLKNEVCSYPVVVNGLNSVKFLFKAVFRSKVQTVQSLRL